MQEWKKEEEIADGTAIHVFKIVKNAVIKICIKYENTGHTSYIKQDEIKNYKN